MDARPSRYAYEKAPDLHSIRWPHEKILAKLHQFGSAYVRVQHQFKAFTLPDGRRSRYGKLGNCFGNARGLADALCRFSPHDKVRRCARYVEGYANYQPHGWLAFNNDWAYDVTWRWRSGVDKVPYWGIALCPIFARELLMQQFHYLRDMGIRPRHVSVLTHPGILDGRFDRQLAEFAMEHRRPI